MMQVFRYVQSLHMKLLTEWLCTTLVLCEKGL